MSPRTLDWVSHMNFRLDETAGCEDGDWCCGRGTCKFIESEAGPAIDNKQEKTTNGDDSYRVYDKCFW